METIDNTTVNAAAQGQKRTKKRTGNKERCAGCQRIFGAEDMRKHPCSLPPRLRSAATARWYEQVKAAVYRRSAKIHSSEAFRFAAEQIRNQENAERRKAILKVLGSAKSPLLLSEIAGRANLRMSFLLGQVIREMENEKLVEQLPYKRWALKPTESEEKQTASKKRRTGT